MINDYIQQHKQSFEPLLKKLCSIPSWTGAEENRAIFCIEQLRSLGYSEILRDEAGNVILPVNIRPGKNNTAFMAHLDTVFSPGDCFEVREEGDRLLAPGIGDNTANAVGLLLLAEYIAVCRPKLRGGVYLVWSTGEEGLGNLRGSRCFTEKHSGDIERFVALDLYYNKIFSSCVGSIRYRVSVTTPGGHSYLDFGNKNAIAAMAELICAVTEGENFNTPGLTYNFGTVSGGTTVNTIAAAAELLFEFRSADSKKMAAADLAFKKLIAESTGDDCRFELETIGFRPCAESPDEAQTTRMTAAAKAAILAAGCPEPSVGSASTDCNIPLSLSIPSICFGVCMGGGMHTRGEWINKGSLETGMEILLDFFRRSCTEE